MTDRDPWLDRLDDLEHQLRRFVDDALGDVLDRIRGELTEEVHASRRRVAGRALRGVHPTVRPVAAAAERFFRWASFASHWNAAALRLRLRSTTSR